MTTAVLINAVDRTIEAFDVDPARPTLAEDLARAIGCQCLALGARLPTGDRIYLDATAIHTSRHFFRHCFVASPLPGSAVVLGDHDLAVDRIRHLIEFLDWADVFPSRAKPRWLRDGALDLPTSAGAALASAFQTRQPGNQNRAAAVSR